MLSNVLEVRKWSGSDSGASTQVVNTKAPPDCGSGRTRAPSSALKTTSYNAIDTS